MPRTASRPASRRRPALTPKAYPPGARVLVRDEEWVVRRARQTRFGATAVEVTGLSEIVRGHDAIFLSDLDEIVELKPEDTGLVHDPSPQYRRSRLYLETLLRRSPPTEPHLVVGHRGAMDVKQYQLRPAAKALSQPRPRILIADAVGLGKTIEAGILVSELIARGRGRRILVVALKSILEQFQQELWARFTIPLVRLDSVGIERVRRRIPANMNPFHYFDRVIISVDTLKKDAKYRRFLEACHWDVTVIDECQHVAVRGGGSSMSQRARLAQLLARTCDSLILTSATPHDGKPESFASLMNLLEPTAVADPSSYTKEEIRGLYMRRFKKDIAEEAGGSFSEREPNSHHLPATDAEDAVFEALRTAEFRTLRARGAGKGVLFRTTLLKGFLSSSEALRRSLAERGKNLERRQQELADNPKATAPDEEDFAHDRDLLGALDTLAAKCPIGDSGKLDELVSLLEDFGVADKKRDERVVIFSERIPTLETLETTLQKRLGLKKGAIGVFHGSLDDKQQMELVKSFGTQDSKLRVLLCSDAAAEGINLHFCCHRLVHYDIPWSLITLEQRNGRIDRYGQHHRPQLHYLFTISGIDEVKDDLRILEVLADKELRAHRNLGDAQWLITLEDGEARSAEAEEERVARGISQREHPDEVVRDPEAEEEDLDDFRATLLAAQNDHELEEASAPATHDPFCLYPEPLEFVRDALFELATEDPTLEEPTWHEEAQGLTFTATDDLRRRFAYMPPELRRDGQDRFKLTGDRDLVQRSLDEARKEPSRWPEWQLLWHQHPVLEWLNDRVLTHFGRHEAPVVRVHQGLGEGEAALVFQGVLSNQESQTVLLDWLAVRFANAEPSDEPTVLPFENLAADVGLATSASNDGKSFAITPLEELRAPAVAVAHAHMLSLRKSRAKQMLPAIKAEHARVKTWADKVLAELATKDSALAARGRKPGGVHRERLRQRREDVEGRVAARRDWVARRLTTTDKPYLRLALVLVGKSYGRQAAKKAGR